MITIFDFDANWDQVTPYLKDKIVLRALDAGMIDYCEQNDLTWVPKDGPCAYADPAWNPKPSKGTPDWYRCYGAAVGLGLWNCVIGKLLFPDLSWSVFEDSTHTIGVGMDSAGMVYMDILHCGTKTAEEIWETVENGTFKSLMHEIVRLEGPKEPKKPKES